MNDGLGDTGPIFQDAQRGIFNYRSVKLRASPAKNVEGGIPGCGEKETASRAQVAVDAGAQDAQKRLLDNVVDILQRREFSSQIGSKDRFVGLNLLGEPAGGF
ncbi:MAG: hypothetical protein U1F61_09010 [Opitutaceae bacterium]